jgi:PAS domain S-box-containing protein
MDRNSMLTYLNKNGQELFKYSIDDLKGGLSAFDLISEEDRPRIIENGRLLMSGILATNNEYFAKRKDNSKFPVQIYSRPIRRGDEIVGIRGICVDISDRKEAEKKIRQSEERYRIILEAFPDLIVMTDISGRIIYNNIPFTELTGFSRETGSESNLFTLIHPDDFDSISDLISELIEGHRRHTPLIEKRLKDTKGEYRWLSGVFSKVVIDNNRALQFIARDITAKKRIEEELEMHRTKLEYLVVERTEELEAMNEELRATNEELYYQRKELRETLESLKETQNKLVHSEKMAIVGLLSAGIAHEINNPLNFIKGGSLGLEDYFNDNFPEHLKNVERLFDAINTGVERSAGIVESLGHYSQAGYRGKKRCDISNILDNCLAIVRDQVMVKGEVEKNYTYEDYYLLGDEGKLHQAFLNILVNSLQAIEKEGLIRISTRLNNSHISIVFEDNGHGMNDEILLKIFDPFFTTRAPGSGKGMGLSITYQIIREHQGTITYTSEVGKGTIATVLLPLSVEADDSVIRKTLKTN